ncbi:MAG: methyltransferase domain-containing protein [Deltaproteobacteria bacterium]|nr:methyltransferase domain-containing protein [Deltaproteobacteria bacterium]
MISTPQIERRRKFLTKHINVAKRKGLEVGPYDRPIVHRDMGDIKYLDYFTADELRQRKAPGRIPEEVVDIDYVVNEKRLTEVVSETFDYVVASHVIEHVPSIIDWLNEMAMLLNKKGVIFLAVPDKRYTFDIGRPLSTTGQIIEHYHTHKKKPSFADVFDTHRYHKKVKPIDVWNGTFSFDRQTYTHDLEHSQRVGQRAMTTYHDCHCNVFTYDRFLEIFSDLQALSLTTFRIKAHQDVVRPFNDFMCVLQKTN